jgi:hypothetical protein
VPYLEAGAFLVGDAGRLRATFDPLALERGEIPALEKNALFETMVEQLAAEAILAYGIRAVLATRPAEIMYLESALRGAFAGAFPGQLVFDYWKGRSTSLSQFDQVIADGVQLLRQDEYMEPSQFWATGLRFFGRIDQSPFRSTLTPHLASWQRAGWKRIAATEAFRLYMPLQTVPLVEAALAVQGDDRRFLAGLLLATCDAVGARLGMGYRDRLRGVAAGTDSPSDDT